MNILQICSKSPWPPNDGGSIAMNNITQGLLNAGHHVKVFAISTPKCNLNHCVLPPDYAKITDFEFGHIDTSIKVSRAFRNLFSKGSYNIERFYSAAIEEKIKNILMNGVYDIVQIESLFATPYIQVIRKNSKAKIILRAHNVEHLIWQRLAEGCKNALKRTYLRYLATKLKNYELQTIQKVDGIAAITPVDKNSFSELNCRCPVISIPVGIDSAKINFIASERDTPGFFHLGSMNWMPNQEGIRWFLENVWEIFYNKFPQYEISFAGRNMPEWLNNTTYKGIKILGEVENAHQFMQSREVMIVPLLSGSGMRVKIIEGMACGNTIITSSIGAEGISYTNEKNILIADTVDEWLKHLIYVVRNPEFCASIGKNAKTLVNELYNNTVITADLTGFYTRILNS